MIDKMRLLTKIKILTSEGDIIKFIDKLLSFIDSLKKSIRVEELDINEVFHVQDNEGQTVFHYLVKKHYLKAMEKLVKLLEPVKLKELINIKDKEGKTVLHLAVLTMSDHNDQKLLRKDLEELKLFLKSGADPNGQNNLGKTALHFSVETILNNNDLKLLDGKLEVLKLFLKSGANPGKPDNQGKIALNYIGDHQCKVSLVENQYGEALQLLSHKRAEYKAAKLILKYEAKYKFNAVLPTKQVEQFLEPCKEVKHELNPIFLAEQMEQLPEYKEKNYGGNKDDCTLATLNRELGSTYNIFDDNSGYNNLNLGYNNH